MRPTWKNRTPRSPPSDCDPDGGDLPTADATKNLRQESAFLLSLIRREVARELTPLRTEAVDHRRRLGRLEEQIEKLRQSVVLLQSRLRMDKQGPGLTAAARSTAERGDTAESGGDGLRRLAGNRPAAAEKAGHGDRGYGRRRKRG